jgi:hypothetical protein
MIWRWLYVTEDMGVVEGIPCSICERPVHDRIWFPSDYKTVLPSERHQVCAKSAGHTTAVFT